MTTATVSVRSSWALFLVERLQRGVAVSLLEQPALQESRPHYLPRAQENWLKWSGPAHSLLS